MIGTVQCVVLDRSNGPGAAQRRPRGWSVYADPAGHPFRLLQAR